MRPGIIITLAIIAGVGIGTGTIVTGVVLLKFGSTADFQATILGAGAAVLGASLAGLVAHVAGCFKSLDQADD